MNRAAALAYLRGVQFDDGCVVAFDAVVRRWRAYWFDGTPLRGGEGCVSLFATSDAAIQALRDGGEAKGRARSASDPR